MCVDFVKVAQKREKKSLFHFFGGNRGQMSSAKKEEVDGPWKMIPFPMDEGRREIDPLIQQRASKESLAKPRTNLLQDQNVSVLLLGSYHLRLGYISERFEQRAPFQSKGKRFPLLFLGGGGGGGGGGGLAFVRKPSAVLPHTKK